MSTYHRRQRSGLLDALDEARFGTQRTLNLRLALPTAAAAVARTEAWLREQQVSAAGEVLVITGRGRGSPDGVSAVREAIRKLLASLRRRGVVSDFSDHTPGSFIITLAPVADLLAAPRRSRDRGSSTAPTDPAALADLEPSTRSLLRDLASRSLTALGTSLSGRFVEDEMLRQFGVLAASIPSGRGSEERLRHAIARAIEELDER
jgi:hypothetical protein